jgi:tetratricopeptide (TPR) repeat protein
MEARRFYKKSISIKNDDSISHYNLANAERVIGDLESAIEHYLFVIGLKEEKKVEIGSLYLNSLINLGICYKNKELYDKAN